MRKLQLAWLLLALVFLMGQHRQVAVVSPYGKSDDPGTTAWEQMSFESFEIHLDEDEFNPAGCIGADNPWDCCTAPGLGATCNDTSSYEIYNGANTLVWGVDEAGKITGTAAYTFTACNLLHEPSANVQNTDDISWFWFAPEAVTVDRVRCISTADTTGGTLSITGMTHTACALNGAGQSQAVTAGGSIAAGTPVSMTITGITVPPVGIRWCIEYTYD